MNIDLTLTGLDGTNPLSFIAALGVVAVSPPLSELRWEWVGRWVPVLTSEFRSIDALVDCVDVDRVKSSASLALALEYDGKRDLKPSPQRFRDYLATLVADSSVHDRLGVDWAAAFGSDVVQDNNGNTKPTALHFTAGQQQFLSMVRELAAGVTSADLREAVEGPWSYRRPLPVMGWDGTSSRDYALRATDPSTDKKLGVPGADWLAIRGLVLLPSFPVADKLMTTGCSGRWKRGAFSWPLWTVPIGYDVIRSLLSLDVTPEGCPPERRAGLGIGGVFSAGIKRSDQGGYGSFEPASPL